MSTKKSIILYGAFDRYNYGDNLMPILMQKYISIKFSDVVDNYNFIYASIQKSNLEKYGCYKTEPIINYLNVTKGSVLIVVGGDTMQADIGLLYLHTIKNKVNHLFLRIFKKLNRNMFMDFSMHKYKSPWLYPYIPSKKSFRYGISIILNTVSGFPVKSQMSNIENIDYISLRDKDSFNFLNKHANVKLVPDSVLLLSKIYPKSELKLMLKNSAVKDFDISEKYVVVQMNPYNASCTAAELAEILLKIKRERNIEPILLPIGYASGHDDIVFLKKVQSFSKNEIKLFYDLSVWEIAYIISNAECYFGTSLHGAITAMSYKVPHFCISSRVKKMVRFLETWSVSPFNMAIEPSDIPNFINPVYNDTQLERAVFVAQESIENHYKYIHDVFLS